MNRDLKLLEIDEDIWVNPTEIIAVYTHYDMGAQFTAVRLAFDDHVILLSSSVKDVIARIKDYTDLEGLK